MKAESEVSRWLNFPPHTRHPETDETDKTAPVSSVSDSPPHVCLEIGDWGQGSGPGRPSPENAVRPIEDRLAEARILLARLHKAYESRFCELWGNGLSEREAHLGAMLAAKENNVYQRWRSLG